MRKFDLAANEADPDAGGVYAPHTLHPPTVVFGKLGRPQLGTKRTVTIDTEDRGTNPVRYPVIVTVD